MLRRMPTSIEMKLDDVLEYENLRREQEAAKEMKNAKPGYNEPPIFSIGPKTRQEIQARIGLHPSPRPNRAGPNPLF